MALNDQLVTVQLTVDELYALRHAVTQRVKDIEHTLQTFGGKDSIIKGGDQPLHDEIEILNHIQRARLA